MQKAKFTAVIGRGFGDEGKGLCTDYLAYHAARPLVIRHNGGAQSGHTVEMPAGNDYRDPEKRFVFHELSSGSFRHADTFWAKNYFPDLYKLREELDDFYAVTGFLPKIYADTRAHITMIDDVLLNMLLEEARGGMRHGSCGMGINEADMRTRAGYGITIGELLCYDVIGLTERLTVIRREYVNNRLSEIQAEYPDRATESPYAELLKDDAVLKNAAETMLHNLRCVRPVYVPLGNADAAKTSLLSFLAPYDHVIFETGQGLLLDSENEEYAPNVTASRTGLTNIVDFLSEIGASLDEVIYVSRSYLTRHGVGNLKNECTPTDLRITGTDRTNMPNPWQGSLRYAYHEDLPGFLLPIKKDLAESARSGISIDCVSLMITHLNETNGCLKTASGDVDPRASLFQEFCSVAKDNSYLSAPKNSIVPKASTARLYLSSSPYSTDVSLSESPS